MRKGSFVSITIFAILIALTCAGFASSAVAQTTTPRFATLTPRYLENLAAPATPTVTHWTGSLSPGGTGFTMVGTDPATTNSSYYSYSLRDSGPDRDHADSDWNL